MALEKELETYRSRLKDLRGQEGKFALVQGDDLVVFGTYEDALREGYQRYGLKPFLVKQIETVEAIQFVTRLLDIPCHT